MKAKEETVIKDQTYKEFIYKISTDEINISVGDYIFDFVNNNYGKCPVFRCDTNYFAELINKEHQKPIAYRRSAKVIASDDPVLNANGIPGL